MSYKVACVTGRGNRRHGRARTVARGRARRARRMRSLPARRERGR